MGAENLKITSIVFWGNHAGNFFTYGGSTRLDGCYTLLLPEMSLRPR